jgi:hypothetical protein
MTDRELIDRLLFLAQTAVDQALDLNYDDPEDYFIYRELRGLKAAVAALAQPEPARQPTFAELLMPPPSAALAQPEPQGPTDEELLMLMPETMRDEFSYAARVCSDATGGKVNPGIFHVALNIVALEYARAVLSAATKPSLLEREAER